MSQEPCNLCGKLQRLRKSHIFPKFVFDWMKKTGAQYLRTSGSPNLRQQDGRKLRLLCVDCEQRFSTREKWFSENIFTPYLSGAQKTFQYDRSLYYFLTSLCWRILLDELSDVTPSHWYGGLASTAEEEWRDFLLNGNRPKTFSEIHLFLTDLGAENEVQPIVNFNRYFTRTVDGTIASSESTCFVYAKFARFITLGAITPFDSSLLVKTRIDPDGGTMGTPQELRDGAVGEFILDRARLQNEAFVTKMSAPQKEIVEAALKQDVARVVSSDLGKAILADYSTLVDPHALWPAPLPDELCTCGSGKAYRECHGGNGNAGSSRS